MRGRIEETLILCLLIFTPCSTRAAASLPGPGASTRFGRSFTPLAEGAGSFGVANWSPAPLPNHFVARSNPSLGGCTVNLSTAWQAELGLPPGTPSPTVSDSNTKALPLATKIVIAESVILLYSSLAYSKQSGVLPGVTLASVLLSGGDGENMGFKRPGSLWIFLGGTAAIVTAEFVMEAQGASKTALFTTSAVSWNAVVLAIGSTERKAGTPRHGH